MPAEEKADGGAGQESSAGIWGQSPLTTTSTTDAAVVRQARAEAGSSCALVTGSIHWLIVRFRRGSSRTLKRVLFSRRHRPAKGDGRGCTHCTTLGPFRAVFTSFFAKVDLCLVLFDLGENFRVNSFAWVSIFAAGPETPAVGAGDRYKAAPAPGRPRLPA